MQQIKNGNPATCDCGKIVAFERNGEIYVKCYRCRREINVSRKLRLSKESRDH